MSNSYQNLNKLSDSLYQELIVKAEAEIKALKDQAKQEAQEELARAKSEADQYIKNEKRQLEVLRKRSLNELKQQGLQLKADIQDEITKSLKYNWLDSIVDSSLKDIGFIQQLILSLSDKSQNGILKMEIPAELEASWKGLLNEKLKDTEYQLGKEFRFKIIQADKGFEIDFGKEEFQSLFHDYIDDKVAAMLFGDE